MEQTNWLTHHEALTLAENMQEADRRIIQLYMSGAPLKVGGLGLYTKLKQTMEQNNKYTDEVAQEVGPGLIDTAHIDVIYDKYFTPSIEDIRIGYELEWRLKKLDWIEYGDKSVYGWQKHIITEQDFSGGELGDDFHSVGNSNCEFRVPYLTKGQLQDEGWTVREANYWKFFFDKDNVMGGIHKNGRLELILKDVLLDEITESSSNGRLYLGECKCINTFRQICKLLNIQ